MASKEHGCGMRQIKARNKITKRDERQKKDDLARIDKATRLRRKGVISKAGKALERKGLGDVVRNPEILKQMQDKHPLRVRQIGPDMYTFVSEESVVIKVEKILGKLNNEAALGPAGLQSSHIRM